VVGAETEHDPDKCPHQTTGERARGQRNEYLEEALDRTPRSIPRMLPTMMQEMNRYRKFESLVKFLTESRIGAGSK
jgi:hypothetical protein